MARQMNFSNELLTTPPPIVGTDVSARWKRTWKREVVMTVILPDDVVDTEIYVKTTKGHIGYPDEPMDVLLLEKELEHSPSPQHPNQGKDEKVHTSESR